jgi:hypothetical protein
MYYGQYMDYYDFISASEKSVGRFVDNVANILSRNVGVTNIEVTMFCAELQQIIMLEIATIVSNENFTKPYFNMKNMKEMI